jgi:hypothetical protein
LQRRLKKAKKQEKKLEKAAIRAQKEKKTDLIYQIYTTVTHHFPLLFDWMRELDDPRKKASPLELAAHLTACLALFIFKAGSRNEYNQKRKDLQFQKNFKKLFGFPMPHGDSVHNVIVLLNETQVERLNQKMVQVLLNRKVFHKSRYRNYWFRIAVDGTGVVSFDHPHCEQCLHQTSKNDKTTYSHKVLDARLVTPNGFSISVASEWIENPEHEEYDKQDCERKAFKRLAAKLKKIYPRLPLIILADALYPYEGFFTLCKTNQWAYLVTFKEGNLKTLWEEVLTLKPLQANNLHTEITYSSTGDKKTEQIFCWVDQIDYKGHSVNWQECCETVTTTQKNAEGSVVVIKIEKKHFVHITDLPLNKKNIAASSYTGRLRWKIENEGFNTLKNGGYGLEHKWARKSYQALKNYFQFMQMGYLINQLMVKSTVFQETFMKDKDHSTLQSLWKDLDAAMKWAKIKAARLAEISATRIQFRFIS